MRNYSDPAVLIHDAFNYKENITFCEHEYPSFSQRQRHDDDEMISSEISSPQLTDRLPHARIE
jgi:hypothetical protein